METYNNNELDRYKLSVKLRYNPAFDYWVDPASQDEEFQRETIAEPRTIMEMTDMIIDKIEKRFNINNSLTSLGAK